MSTSIAALVLAQALIVRSEGKPVTALPCGMNLAVSDSGPTPTGKVIFHADSAEVSFDGVEYEPVTLFVYVDDTYVALLTVKGALKVVVPLDARQHHKIVTGRSSQGLATSISAVCT